MLKCHSYNNPTTKTVNGFSQHHYCFKARKKNTNLTRSKSKNMAQPTKTSKL